MSSKSTGVLSLLLQSPLGGTLVAWYSVGRGSTLVLVGPLALLRGAGITSRKIPRDQAPPDQRPTARRRPFSAANSASSWAEPMCSIERDPPYRLAARHLRPSDLPQESQIPRSTTVFFTRARSPSTAGNAPVGTSGA